MNYDDWKTNPPDPPNKKLRITCEVVVEVAIEDPEQNLHHLAKAIAAQIGPPSAIDTLEFDVQIKNEEILNTED